MRTALVAVPLDTAVEKARKWGDHKAMDIEAIEDGLDIPTAPLSLFAASAAGKKMLDVGCGSARYVDWFLERGFDYTGIDVSEGLVQVAQNRNSGVVFRQMSYHKLDFDDETFDMLWVCCSLEFCPKEHIDTVLRELHRVLRVGGKILVISPQSTSSYETVLRHEAQATEVPYACWVPEELEMALVLAGFVPLEGVRYGDGPMSILAQR